MSDTISLETTPKSVSFISRNTANNDKKMSILEDEIKQLEGQTTTQEEVVVAPPEDEGLTKEDKNWKKRYSDLRSHQQKEAAQLRKEIEELKNSLKANTDAALPKTREEVEAWVKKFPDVARIVKQLARGEAAEETRVLEERMKEFDKIRVNTEIEKAKNALLKIHPDFVELSETEEFHDWLDEQPSWMQSAMYEELDVKGAARVMDLYKADKKIRPKSTKDAAIVINTQSRSAPTSNAVQGSFSESQVQKMSMAEYVKNEAAIYEAIRNGKFIYDMSGAAR